MLCIYNYIPVYIYEYPCNEPYFYVQNIINTKYIFLKFKKAYMVIDNLRNHSNFTSNPLVTSYT